MNMAAVERTLDVAEPQVLVHYPNDPHLTEHHRLLLVKVSAGRWIAASPDHELDLLDLNTHRHVVLRRNSDFPPHLVNDAYIFDPIHRHDLERLRQEAKIMAMVLNDDDMDEVPAQVWVFSDPNSVMLGKEVPADVFAGAVTLSGKGLVEHNGTIEIIEEIALDQLQSFAEAKRGVLGDLRLIGNHADLSGKRFISLQDAFPLFKESQMKDWGFSGPRAVKEYLESIREASSDLASYHLQWLQHSGANPRTALVHEHRNIIEVLRLGVSRDQLDVSNLLSFELLVRRAIQLELAVARSPQNPEFAGLEALMEAPLTSPGSASTRGLDLWLTERLKEKAQIQKQARLFKEEMGRGSKSSGAVQGEDAGSGGGGGWRRKKKAAAKAKGASSSTAGAGET